MFSWFSHWAAFYMDHNIESNGRSGWKQRETSLTEAQVSDGVLGQEVAALPVNCQCC